MERALRQTVVIGPEGRVEIARTELVPGTTAEIIVLSLEGRVPTFAAPVDRKALVDRLKALSDQAIADGMETWDIDRINAEVHERRYGDRERYS